jgi:3-deoxy-D-manno-octulosonic-acid transferase
VLGISVETEAWPNLVAIASERHTPMVLVNGRLSERSYRLSRRYAGLMRETAERFSLALAQTRADADRIRQVGAKEVEVAGNLKFDFTPDQVQIARGRAWRRVLGDRPVWLFASTRDGEEAMILDALGQRVDATIVLVPRHPQRFDEVAQMIAARGLPMVRRSTANFETDHQGKVFLGDSMCEMPLYYAAADVAFIGGSLLNLGGQNLIEACAVGTPVVVGPYTFNFEQATQDAIEARAAIRVGDAKEAVATMASIANDRSQRQQMSEAALKFAGAHRGATARTLARLAPLIEVASAVESAQPVATELPDR